MAQFYLPAEPHSSEDVERVIKSMRWHKSTAQARHRHVASYVANLCPMRVTCVLTGAVLCRAHCLLSPWLSTPAALQTRRACYSHTATKQALSMDVPPSSGSRAMKVWELQGVPCSSHTHRTVNLSCSCASPVAAAGYRLQAMLPSVQRAPTRRQG